jgi:glutamate racemase
VTDPRPIGLFDSGVGGLTVLREVIRRLPAESTVYLGDNARTPYGTRPDEEVRRFSLECLDELTSRDVKALVVACNTTSSVALAEARRRYDVPVLGVVRPGAAAAALATRSGRVGVIATPATVRSGAYFRAIRDEDPRVEVYEHATPDLVPLVEAGRLEGPEVEAAVRGSLAPLLGDLDYRSPTVGGRPLRGPIDVLLLGCTHYPLLGPLIKEVVGPEVAVIDSASATASALAELLAVSGLEASDDARPTHAQLTTGEVAAFERTAERLFGDGFHSVRPIALAGVA